MPQQKFGQQRAALPNKLRRCARMHTCNPWPVLEHMAQTHASRLTVFICWAFSGAQVLSEMIILTLPRRESSWFSLCQRENLLEEAKQVDVRLCRNEGREGRSFSDLVRREQCLVTAKQFSPGFPDYAATVLFVVLGMAFRLHVTIKPHKKQRAQCNELDEGCLGWRATRGQRRDDDVQRPNQPADLKEHVHHTSWTYLWACASRIPYGHIQTKLTFICGFSLNPPPPPPNNNNRYRIYSLVQWNWFSGVTGCTWNSCIQWRQRTNFTAPGCRGRFQVNVNLIGDSK